MFASAPELLRLLVVPVFAWAAYRDLRTRRVLNWLWPPVVGIGLLAFSLDVMSHIDRAVLFLRGSISLTVGALGYIFWRHNSMGGADAKALMALAVCFPDYPVMYLPQTILAVALPLSWSPHSVFSLSILTNTVLLGLIVPFTLALRNASNGQLRPEMVIARPVSVDRVPRMYGRLLTQSPSTAGLDIDALRMYLTWRRTTLGTIRSAPKIHRDPASVPASPNDPGDGSLAESAGRSLVTVDGSNRFEGVRTDQEYDDPWGAEAFLSDTETAYGTTPDDLRSGLEQLCSSEFVWISPGVPFLVPLFFGLVAALTVGDLLWLFLRSIGL